jgi:hypothetical protein
MAVLLDDQDESISGTLRAIEHLDQETGSEALPTIVAEHEVPSFHPAIVDAASVATPHRFPTVLGHEIRPRAVEAGEDMTEHTRLVQMRIL